MKVLEVKKLIEIFTESGLEEMRLESGEDRLCLKRGRAGFPPAPCPPFGEQVTEQAEDVKKTLKTALTEEPEEDEGGELITAPLVGVFYRAPAPEEEPFVREGQMVKKGDVMCVIEAMKMMNELKAEFDGTVRRIAVKNGEAVEFGQVLFEVEKC